MPETEAPPQISENLAAAVEAAYAAFSFATIPSRLHVCRCNVCFGDDVAAEAALVRTPLRQITAEQLSEYTNSAHGWHDEMLYFLPRYFDLLAQRQSPAYLDADYALSRLSNIDWHADWPLAQSAVVDGFFLALVSDRLANGWFHKWDNDPEAAMSYSEVRDVLRLAGNAGGDVGMLLARMEDTGSFKSALHIATLALDAGPKLFEGKLGWHTLGEHGQRLIADWLARPDIVRQLEAAFFEAKDPAAQATFSLAVNLLEGVIVQRKLG